MVFGNKQLMKAGGGVTLETPEYISSGTLSEVGSNSTISIPYPTVVTEGKLLILFLYVYTGSSSGTVTYPSISGWTLQNSNDDFGWIALGIYTKQATGSESGNLNVTFGVSYTRIFGMIGQYTYNQVESTYIPAGSSSNITFNNTNTTPESGGLYIAGFGQTSSNVTTITSTNYSEDNQDNGSLNTISLASYYASSNTDDGDIVFTASSFNIVGGIIIS